MLSASDVVEHRIGYQVVLDQVEQHARATGVATDELYSMLLSIGLVVIWIGRMLDGLGMEALAYL